MSLLFAVNRELIWPDSVRESLGERGPACRCSALMRASELKNNPNLNKIFCGSRCESWILFVT